MFYRPKLHFAKVQLISVHTAWFRLRRVRLNLLDQLIVATESPDIA